jgi:DNA-binding FadR family transcriptional regulator
MSRSSSLPAVSRGSLVSSTIEVLRARVADGTWKVGDRIPPEAELAEQLQVGRNTVREAIRVLWHSQMLEVRQGDGTYVRRDIDPTETMEKISRSSLRDHLELQSILEAEAARFAARRRTKEDIAKLPGILAARGERAPDEPLADFLKRDRAFHLAIAAAAHNTAIEALYRFFALSIPVHEHAISSDGASVEADLASHQAILDAIVARDEEAAAQAAKHVLSRRIERLSAEAAGAAEKPAVIS